MATYLLKRLLLIIPTLLGIMLISFAIIQFAPGGPVERIIAQLSGNDVSAAVMAAPSTAARRASIRNSSRASRSSSASTSRRTSASS
jgi:microcin C transport system permease protein